MAYDSGGLLASLEMFNANLYCSSFVVSGPLSRHHSCVAETCLLQSAVPLGMFVGSTLVAITFMGGVYAILPAYEADLFGECPTLCVICACRVM